MYAVWRPCRQHPIPEQGRDFVGAAIVHLRAGDYSVSGQHELLLLTVATLALDLVS